MGTIPTKLELIECADRIAPYIHNTAILTSQTIDNLSGTEIFFKCENFQKMGAFKMRGATNAILQLTEEEKAKGVVTHSSGNFAQAVSLAAQNLEVKAHIVMPKNAPQPKKKAVIGYGGIITECEPTLEARETMVSEIITQTGTVPLHPSNQMEVIIGQGTAAMELLEKQPDLDLILIPVGGGGLLAGTALAAHYFSKNCKVIGAEPKGADDAFRSLAAGKILDNKSANTIADGLRTRLGDQNFPIIQEFVDKIVLVEEQEIIDTMKLVWERMKMIIEPSSAVAIAPVLRGEFKGEKVGIIVSGGNVDLANLPF
ncbi:MAG: pyridoxal-phosphate dependent enzyme [Flavobacteriales bacterium]|nr:pyridoxal-phosphate dependent enzyme [Flavobacteriales bacterium]